MRVIDCGDNLEQLKKLPDACVDLIYIDPPFNSNRNYEVFWGETKEKRSGSARLPLMPPQVTCTGCACGRKFSIGCSRRTYAQRTRPHTESFVRMRSSGWGKRREIPSMRS